MFGVTFETFAHSLHESNILFLVLEVNVGDPLLDFAEDDSCISFGYNPQVVMTIISDIQRSPTIEHHHVDFNDDVEVNAFHAEDDDRKMPARTTSCRAFDCRRTESACKANKTESDRKADKTVHKRVKSRNDFSDDEAIVMLEEEKKRPSSKFDAEGKRQRFGSFYDRHCYDNSFAEMAAKIRDKDRIRTIDLNTEDQMKFRFEESDDSKRSSDWKKRTGFSMKSARPRGKTHTFSTRKPNKALTAYNVRRLAQKAQELVHTNFKKD